MTSPEALPSLFGRFTAILKDHDHLKGTLRRLRQMSSALDACQQLLPSALAPERLVKELRADLVEHFAAEESEEYFGTVVDEAPALGPRIDALVEEHGLMLELVDHLLELASERRRWPALPARTRQLVAQLEAHERAESALLGELFGGGPRDRR